MKNLKFNLDLSGKNVRLSSSVFNISNFVLPIGNSGHLLLDLINIGDWVQKSWNLLNESQFFCFMGEQVNSYFVPHEVFNVDAWEQHDDHVVRIHNVYRKRLCIPEAKDCPVPLEELTGERITHVRFRDDSTTTIKDNFKTSKSATRGLEREWKGKTIYKIKTTSTSSGSRDVTSSKNNKKETIEPALHLNQ